MYYDQINKRSTPPIIMGLVGILLLFIGFLFSRVVCNIGFLILGISTLYQFKKGFPLLKDRYFITFCFLALLPLLWDIYQGGATFYTHRGIMKLLLVLFPLFVFSFAPDKRIRSFVHIVFMLIMLLSTCYSMYHYWIDYDKINELYKVSKVMSVLSFGDHIRISWATGISIVLAVYERTSSTIVWQKRILLVYIILQVVFLHLLGAKTGLIVLYISACIYFIWMLPRDKKWWLAIIIPFIFMMPIAAYYTMPTFTQRVNYIKYDFEHYSRNEYKDGLSDSARFYSCKAGVNIIENNPFLGVGFIKLQDETNLWYKNHLPEMSPKNYFLPSSEIIIYMASGGILGLLVILLHMCMPLTVGYLRNDMWFMLFYAPATLSFIFETHLEGQLPLFVYGFFISWFWYLAKVHSDETHKILVDN